MLLSITVEIFSLKLLVTSCVDHTDGGSHLKKCIFPKALGKKQISVADPESCIEWHVLSCLQPDCFRGQKLFINLIPSVLPEK